MFPKIFETRYPFVNPMEISLDVFFDTSLLGDKEYYFHENSITLSPYANTITVVLQKNHKQTFSFIQKLSYPIMMINTAYMQEPIFLKEIQKEIFHSSTLLNINIYRTYILQYLMSCENLLDPNRTTNLSEVSLTESKSIIFALRRKVWNLLINWSIYPIDLETNICTLLQTLESLKEHRRFHPNVSNNLDIELEAFTSNLTLKNQRIVSAYSRYYFGILHKSQLLDLYSRIPQKILKDLSRETQSKIATLSSLQKL